LSCRLVCLQLPSTLSISSKHGLVQPSLFPPVSRSMPSILSIYIYRQYLTGYLSGPVRYPAQFCITELRLEAAATCPVWFPGSRFHFGMDVFSLPSTLADAATTGLSFPKHATCISIPFSTSSIPPLSPTCSPLGMRGTQNEAAWKHWKKTGERGRRLQATTENNVHHLGEGYPESDTERGKLRGRGWPPREVRFQGELEAFGPCSSFSKFTADQICVSG